MVTLLVVAGIREARLAALAAEVLAGWRDAERLLMLLPPLDPDRATVTTALHEMQTLYHELIATVSEAERTPDVIARARGRIDQTRALLRETRARLDRSVTEAF